MPRSQTSSVSIYRTPIYGTNNSEVLNGDVDKSWTDDHIQGFNGDDTLYGFTGSDILEGVWGNDYRQVKKSAASKNIGTGLDLLPLAQMGKILSVGAGITQLKYGECYKRQLDHQLPQMV